MASNARPPCKMVKKCRQYDLSYLEFGFISSPNDNIKPMCLICGSLFSNEAMKPSRLKDQLTRLHSSKLNADFKKIRADWGNKRNIKALFAKIDIRLENGLTASYNILLMIARTGKPHTIDEKLILPCVKEVIETVMCQSSTPVLSTVALSNDTVQRRINEMGDDVAKHDNGELHDTLDFIVKCISIIKAESLNDRIFRLLFQDNDEDFERLLLQTEFRWLFKGACLTRFYLLYDTVFEERC